MGGSAVRCARAVSDQAVPCASAGGGIAPGTSSASHQPGPTGAPVGNAGTAQTATNGAAQRPLRTAAGGGAQRSARAASTPPRANPGASGGGCIISPADGSASRHSAVPRWPTCVYGPAVAVRAADHGIRPVRPSPDGLRAPHAASDDLRPATCAVRSASAALQPIRAGVPIGLPASCVRTRPLTALDRHGHPRCG